ncbi:MAG: LysM peptidoglycan-binding domain-containing protein, partial [Desulfobacteraceae bacterium]
MRRIVTTICVLSLLALVSGCVPKIMSPTQLADQYITTARRLEEKGDLINALKQYQLALTVDSQNQYAIERMTQLRKGFRERIIKHYQDGVAFNKKGQYRNARREFLKVLLYDPEHAQALKMLKEQKLFAEEVEGYLVHKIQKNETISLLAKKYYGDAKKFRIIAEYNRMEDATKIRLGQAIKIPVIDGTYFFKSPEEKITLAREIPESELTKVINVKNDITHVVQPGESLTTL